MKRGIIIRLLAVCLIITQLLTGNCVAQMAKAAKSKVKSVSVGAPYEKAVYIAKGKKIKLSVNVAVKGKKSKYKKVKFASNNAKIATVNKKGVVKGKKTGKTKITVTSVTNKKKKATLKVVVKKNAVKKVTISNASADLKVGEQTKLNVTVKAKKNASKKVYWTSSDITVATVDRKGNVVAVGEGSANVTVMATDGSKKKASCKIDVQAVNSEEPEATKAPEATVKPQETTKPDATGKPQETTKPDATDKPQETTKPDATDRPQETTKPDATDKPQETTKPDATGKPQETTKPDATNKPQETAKPTPTLKPTPTPAPTPTLEPSVVIDKIQITDNDCIMFLMDEACDLTSSNIVVEIKNSETDTYRKSKVRSMKAYSDNREYCVYLQESLCVPNQGYVRLTIEREGMGPVSQELHYNKKSAHYVKEDVYRCEKGVSISYELWFDIIGDINFSYLGDLPDGLSYATTSGSVRIKGAPTQTGVTRTKMIGTDSAGNTYEYTYLFCVGATNEIVGTAASAYGLIDKAIDTAIRANGGSGSYSYSIEKKPEVATEATVSSRGTVSCKFSEAGNYIVTVKITDTTNPEIYTMVDVVYNIATSYKVSGILTDLGGTGVEFLGGELTIYFEPEDDNIKEQYYDGWQINADTDDGGAISENLVPGTYDFVVHDSDGYEMFRKSNIVVTNQNIDLGKIKLPRVQVTLSAPNGMNLYRTAWQDENNRDVGAHANFLVEPGTYNLHSDREGLTVVSHLYDMTVSFTATDKSIVKTVKMTERKNNIPVITLGTPVDMEAGPDVPVKFYQFTPTETGKYRFTTEGASQSGRIYGYTDVTCAFSDNFFETKKDGTQVDRTVKLYEGVTYYYRTMLYSYDDTYKFTITKAE